MASVQGGFEMDDQKGLNNRLERMLKTGLDLEATAGLVDEEEYEIEDDEEEAADEEAAAEEGAAEEAPQEEL